MRLYICLPTQEVADKLLDNRNIYRVSNEFVFVAEVKIVGKGEGFWKAKQLE